MGVIDRICGTDRGGGDVAEDNKKAGSAVTRRDLTVAAITAALVILIGGAGFGIAALVGGEDDQSASSTSTRTAAAETSVPRPTATAAGTTRAVVVAIGGPVTKGGVTLTFDSVTNQPAIAVTRGPERTPQPGGKYVRLDTTIKNDGRQSMDLTCSFDVQVVLVDSQRRQFDHVEDQYEIDGNPECNAGLQPGFSTNMAYVFEVPVAAEVTLFGFGDPNVKYNDFVWISLA
jgi:hypothetical protein